MSMKGLTDVLLSYFQVLDIFAFTIAAAAAAIINVIIPPLSAEEQLTHPMGSQEPRNTQTPPCPRSPGTQGQSLRHT